MRASCLCLRREASGCQVATFPPRHGPEDARRHGGEHGPVGKARGREHPPGPMVTDVEKVELAGRAKEQARPVEPSAELFRHPVLQREGTAHGLEKPPEAALREASRHDLGKRENALRLVLEPTTCMTERFRGINKAPSARRRLKAFAVGTSR